MKNEAGLKERIKEHLTGIRSAEGVYQLFKLLNYPGNTLSEPGTKRKLDEFDLKKEERDKVKTIYSILGFGKDLPVFLIETATIAPSFVKYVSKVFSERYIRVLLILCADKTYEEILFVLPDYEKRTDKDERKLKLTRLTIQKSELYWTDLDTLAHLFYEGEETSWREVWKKWKEAFNVERVTDAFFEDYKRVFFELRDVVREQLRSRPLGVKESHEFTLQLLNRVMFVYFISRKRWLNDNPKFMKYFWDRYRKEVRAGGVKADSFYDLWLKAVFFKAFNNRNHEIKELPPDVKGVLEDAPYLNGGLFTENLHDRLNVRITDKLFEDLFDFYEKYNFSIKEDMPLESEVAVDPQMLGYVYESLANVADEIYDRNDLGIFYTPRVEVDFMCRRCLVEYLAKRLPDVPKEKFYQLAFDDDKEDVEKYFDKMKLWYELEDVLGRLSVVDPACGSGAFLVGMVRLLAQIYYLINKHTDRHETDFQLKEKIIGRSIYGVDVMPWAVHAAELRLWLQLVVETDFKKEELRERPLLPNLNLNLRVGDSLVQEIGGLNLHLRDTNIPQSLKAKLYDIKGEKEKYFYNLRKDEGAAKEILDKEIRIFTEIIDDRIDKLKTESDRQESKLRMLEKTTQKDLLGGEKKVSQEELDKIEQSIKRLSEQIKSLENVKKNLRDPEKKPFVWEIDFAEIFGDKGGFDIVIGNPPYVRQEKISPPEKLKATVTKNDRTEYKDKLIRSVQAHFPVVRKIDKKSDYYVYFYFHGLSLLNPKGTFCFITSNSWLDVDYGAELQEFLLKYAPIIAIYDNPKRSFAHADINTIIALFGAPQVNHETAGGVMWSGPKSWPALSQTAKFVMFKKPFEELLSSKNLSTIERITANFRGEGIAELVKDVIKTDDFRVFPVVQEDLLEDGWEYPEYYDKKNGRFREGVYEGNNWGGKYLRAPDVFYRILEKGGAKVTELEDLALLRFGIKTGVNDFFYLDQVACAEWKIEKEFLKPVVTSQKECKKIVVKPSDLKYKVFICNKPKSALKGTNALRYIEWGEKQKTKEGVLWCKVPSVQGRKFWYGISQQEKQDFIMLRFRDLRNWTPLIREDVLIGDVVFVGRYFEGQNIKLLDAYLNSTVQVLVTEIYGRKNLGDGLLTTYGPELARLPVLSKSSIKGEMSRLDKPMEQLYKREVKPIFEELGINPTKPIREQQPQPLPDKAELDRVIFDELGLSEQERKEVYWAVCELVKQRLEKARSLKKYG